MRCSVRVTETESRVVDAEGGGMESQCLMGTDF